MKTEDISLHLHEETELVLNCTYQKESKEDINSGAWLRKTKFMYIVMMTKEGSTKIVNFMTPGAGVLALGRGHISHIVKIHYFFKNLLLYS